MKRVLALALTAFAVACQDHTPLGVPTGPQAAISDGRHGAGNPDFFFLPPLVPNPSGDPSFEPAEFNAALRPSVQICTWSGTACGAVVASFTMTSGLGSETIQVGDDKYQVNWHTDLSNLNPALTYRIRVLVGSQELGFADVDVVSSGKELKNVNTQEFIGLLDGRTLPIKFRIENAALCTPAGSDACASETIDLAVGGSVITQRGDRIDIPPQASGQVITVTLQYCEGIDTDLPTFGPCLQATADPPLSQDLFPRAVVSICSLGPITGLTEEQEDLVTLLKRDGEVITALPHSLDFCPEPIGRTPVPGVRGMLLAGWNAVAAVLGPRPLYASLVMLDVGGGGETPDFSDFQFALPAIMSRLPNTDAQSAAPGHAVPVPPGVMLTDWHGDPVAGATVHFEIVLGDGSVTPTEVVSDANGVARVTAWVLGQPGPAQLRASGAGIADHGTPFMPDITDPTAEQSVVPVGNGELLFSATGVSPDGIAAGVGSAGIDGTMSAGEWDPAGCHSFFANLPEGGTTPASLCVMNDKTNLYVAVRFARTFVDPGNSLGLEFDNDNDGVAENGDDVLLVNPSIGFKDEFRTNIPPCPAGSGPASCGFFDTDDGGTNDGAGAFANDGTHSVYEISHPLNSADNAHDFSLGYGQQVGMFLFLRMLAAGAVFPAGFGDTDFPGFRNYLRITTAIPGTVTIDEVNLTSTELVIGGLGVPYTALVTNATGATHLVVVMQAWIEQGTAIRDANGTQVHCTSTVGQLPPGPCSVSFTVAASNDASGSGTLVPGAATARFVLYNAASGTFDEFTVPVTLVKAITIDDVELSSTELVIGGVGVPYTATVSNRTGDAFEGMIVQAYILQGSATRAANSTMVQCTDNVGELPPGTCSVEFTVVASNTASGSGTLVPGPATARFELLNAGDGTFDEFTVAVTLVAPPPLSATADGSVRDGLTSAKDGNADAVFSNSVVQVLNVDRPVQPFEDRGIVEFRIADLAGPVSTVELELDRFASTGPYPFTVGLFGYTGDGAVMLSDFGAGSLLSSFQYAGESTIRLDVTSFVQGLRAASAEYAGFNLRFTVPTTIALNGPFVAFNSQAFPPAARLLVR